MRARIGSCFLLIFVLALGGCVSKDVPTGLAVHDEKSAAMPEAPETLCKKPYFEYKNGECCPDTDDNLLCDWDQPKEEPHSFDTEEVSLTDEFAKKMPKSADIRKEYALMIDDDDHTLGNNKTAFTFVLFQDFESPLSKEFEEDIFPYLKLNYINTGKGKLIFKHYPLSYFENSKKAAEVAECAGSQGKFWEMKKLLFTHSPEFSNTLYFELARQLELDIDDFRLCFESGNMSKKIDYDKAFGDYVWIERTPTLFVNGRRMDGLQPWSEYEDTVKRVKKWEWENSR